MHSSKTRRLRSLREGEAALGLLVILCLCGCGPIGAGVALSTQGGRSSSNLPAPASAPRSASTPPATRSLSSSVAVPVTLGADTDALSVEYTTDDVTASPTWQAAVIAGTSAGSVSGNRISDLNGGSVTVTWDAATSLGPGGHVGVTIRFTPSGPGGQGDVADYGPVTVGNTAPVVTILQPATAATLTGNVVFQVRVTDEESDPVNLLLELNDPILGVKPLTLATAAPLAGLPTQPAADGGAVLTYVWDSASDLLSSTNLTLVATPDDGDPKTSEVAASVGSLTVDNNQAPLASVVTPEADDSGDIAIRYVLRDAESNPIDVAVEVSLDGGVTFAPATRRPGAPGEALTALASSPAGTKHTFLWDSVADTAFTEGEVVVRITPSDVKVGTSGETLPPAYVVNRHFHQFDMYAYSSTDGGAVAHDLDGDGLLDVFFPADNTTGRALYQSAAGLSATAVDLGMGSGYRFAVSADVDGDGVEELAVSRTDGTVVVRQPGSGAIAATTAGVTPAGVAAGFLDADGAADVVVALSGEGRIGVLRGSVGGLLPVVKINAGTSPVQVAVGDVNGDGKADAVCTNQGSNTLGVFLGDGAGSLGAMTSYPAGVTPQGLALGDFDGNGRADVAFTSRGSDQVGVYYQDLAGNLGSLTWLTADNDPTGLVALDLDLDGRTDLCVLSRLDHVLRVYRQDASGVLRFEGAHQVSFNYSVSPGIPRYPAYLSAGDTNSDGLPDLLVSGQAVNVLRNRALGNVPSESVTYALPFENTLLDLGDVDGDGRTDIAVTHRAEWLVSVFQQSDSGRLVLASSFSTGLGQPSGIGIGDLNADGRPDLVVGETPRYDLGDTHIYTQAADGAFSSYWSSPFQETTDVTLGDLNNDSLLDVVATSWDLGVRVYLQQAGGSWLSGPSYSFGVWTANRVEIRDVSGDGAADAVAAVPWQHNFYVSRWTGGTTFATDTYSTLGERCYSIALGDFDSDGRGDVAAPLRETGRVFVYYQDALGSLANRITQVSSGAVANTESEAASGDLNGDGRDDLVVVYRNASFFGVGLFLQDPAGSGTFLPERRWALAGASRPEIGDVNGDGKDDLVITVSSQAKMHVYYQR